MSMSADIAITTVTSIFVIACIVGNCFACAVVLRNRDMRIPINYLLVNLAVADIMYSTFMIPPIILSHNVSHREGAVTGRVLCALLTGENVAWIGACASVFTLNAIAIERYFAVLYPHGNKGKLTMRKLKVIIPGSWIVGLIVQFPFDFSINFDKKQNSCFITEKWTRQVVSIVFYVYIFLSCILLVVLYSRIAYTLWFKRNDDNVLTHQQQGVLKVRKRVTLMVVAVSAIFVISYGTDAALHILIEYVDSIKPGAYVIPIAHTMIIFNSAVNPYAYALINQRFREKMKRMICCNSTSSATRVAPAREQQDIEMTNNIGIQSPSNIAGQPSTE